MRESGARERGTDKKGSVGARGAAPAPAFVPPPPLSPSPLLAASIALGRPSVTDTHTQRETSAIFSRTNHNDSTTDSNRSAAAAAARHARVVVHLLALLPFARARAFPNDRGGALDGDRHAAAEARGGVSSTRCFLDGGAGVSKGAFAQGRREDKAAQRLPLPLCRARPMANPPPLNPFNPFNHTATPPRATRRPRLRPASASSRRAPRASSCRRRPSAAAAAKRAAAAARAAATKPPNPSRPTRSTTRRR